MAGWPVRKPPRPVAQHAEAAGGCDQCSAVTVRMDGRERVAHQAACPRWLQLATR
jgi:hypothetical protein